MIDAAPYRSVLTKLHADGATDQSIADRIGYSATAVRYIRTGRTTLIHVQTARAIAAMLEGKRV